MNSVFQAALAIGVSTLMGCLCGFLLYKISRDFDRRWNDRTTAFAAGVMLAAAVYGLFVPAMDLADRGAALLVPAGALCGVLLMRLVGRFGGKLPGGNPELIFVLAIILHKFPEGMAGGVGLNGMNPAAAATIILGIALQNLPEGAVMMPPLMKAGLKPWRALTVALFTAALNATGVFAGAFWGRLPGAGMPFALAFAGGAMMDVILKQMLPGSRRGGIALMGFLIMSAVNAAF